MDFTGAWPCRFLYGRSRSNGLTPGEPLTASHCVLSVWYESSHPRNLPPDSPPPPFPRVIGSGSLEVDGWDGYFSPSSLPRASADPRHLFYAPTITAWPPISLCISSLGNSTPITFGDSKLLSCPPKFSLGPIMPSWPRPIYSVGRVVALFFRVISFHGTSTPPIDLISLPAW